MRDTQRKMHAVRAVKFLHYSLREAARAYGLTSTTLHRLVHGGRVNSKSRPRAGSSSLSEQRALLCSMTQAAVALSTLHEVRSPEECDEEDSLSAAAGAGAGAGGSARAGGSSARQPLPGGSSAAPLSRRPFSPMPHSAAQAPPPWPAPQRRL